MHRLTLRERLLGLAAPLIVAAAGTDRLARLARPGGGGRKLGPEAAEALAAAVASNDAGRMAEALRPVRPFDSRGWLGELRAPALVVAGDSDLVVSPGQAPLLASGIPDARLRLVSGGGHQLPLSHPEELARLVDEWLAPDPP